MSKIHQVCILREEPLHRLKVRILVCQIFHIYHMRHLDKNKLLYGRMPEKRNEVVLDKQLIDKVTEYTSAVSLMYDGYESYVGAKTPRK